jgi:hypothetical protein
VRTTLAGTLLTVGLATLLGLLANGARLELTNPNLSRTSAALLALLSIGLGVGLLYRIKQANQAFAERSSELASLQEEFRNMQALARDAPSDKIAVLEAEANERIRATYAWLLAELPAHAESFLRPDSSTQGGKRISQFGPSDDLVRKLGVHLNTLSDIALSLAREKPA